MSKSTTKWVPKEETIGVPGRGYIRKEDFSDTDLKALKARAKNRKVDEHTFLLAAGLVPVNGEFKLELEEDAEEVDGDGTIIEAKEVAEEVTETPKKGGKKKAEVTE